MTDTIIGDGLKLDGDVSGGDAVAIEGRVRGSIDVDAPVHVEREGTVEADVEAEEVHVEGQLDGHIRAGERARLEDRCRVVGDIVARRIHIADGANFKGHIDMNVE